MYYKLHINMMTTEEKQECQRLADAVVVLCGQFRECCVEVERSLEREGIRRHLGQLCREGRKRIDEDVTELWIALMDAYEILRDEDMLQEVLNRVSQVMGRLESSTENVKLLSYCYYYVEEQECAVLARKMLDGLRNGGGGDGLRAAIGAYRECIGDN